MSAEGQTSNAPIVSVIFVNENENYQKQKITIPLTKTKTEKYWKLKLN